MPYSLTSLPSEYPYSFEPEQINQPFENIPSNNMTLQNLLMQKNKMLLDMNLFIETNYRGLYREIGIVRQGSEISLQNPNDIRMYIESGRLPSQLTSQLIEFMDLIDSAEAIRATFGSSNPVRLDPILANQWNQFKNNILTSYPHFHSSTLDYNKPTPQELGNNSIQEEDSNLGDLDSID